MCGIGGYLGDAQRAAPLDEAALAFRLRNRGPDAQGSVRFATKGGVPGFLFSARLAILDPSPTANQPMASRDGKLLLVHNGEIYNHADLRRELEQKGARFLTHSDTEVVLHGYKLYGAALWPRLRGMFAIALWDDEQQCLVIARDAMGIKPLYYAHDGSRLVFASELRALLDSRAVERRIDPAGLASYLSWGSVAEPYTIVAGARLLPPGHVLCVRPNRAPGAAAISVEEPRRFADPSPTPLAGSDRDSGMRLSSVLRETVARHLVSDVPVALLLSGGVDSTAIAALLRDIAPEQPICAFTLGTGDNGEEHEAAKTAAIFGIDHQPCPISAAFALDAAPRFLRALDQPSLDGFNTFLVCERVKLAGYKVVLSGLGGDELFLGYKMHRTFAALWTLVAPAARILGQEAAMAAALYRRLRGLWPRRIVQSLLRADLSFHAGLPFVRRDGLQATGGNPWDLFHSGLSWVRSLEQRNYLLHTLLHDSDVMSMAHGVELRVPLCDRWLWSAVLAEGAAAVGPHKQLFVDAVKSTLRDPKAAARLSAVASGQKRGFVLPISDWLRGPGGLSASLSERFFDAPLVRAAGLRHKTLQHLLRVYSHGGKPLRRRLTYRVFALYVLLSYVQEHSLRIA